MPDNLRTLYDNLRKQEPNFTVEWDAFQKDMQDENNLSRLHTNLTDRVEGFSIPFEDFKVDMLGGIQEEDIVEKTIPKVELPEGPVRKEAPPLTDDQFLEKFFPNTSRDIAAQAAATPQVAPTPAEAEIVAPEAVTQAEEALFDSKGAFGEANSDIAARSSSTDIALQLPPDIINTENREQRKQAEQAMIAERAEQRLTSEMTPPPEPTKDEVEYEVDVAINMGGFEEPSYMDSWNDHMAHLRNSNPAVYSRMEAQTAPDGDGLSASERLLGTYATTALAPGLSLLPAFAHLSAKGISDKERFDLFRSAVNRKYNEINKDFEILRARGVEDNLATLEDFQEKMNVIEAGVVERGGVEALSPEEQTELQGAISAVMDDLKGFMTPEVQANINEFSNLSARATQIDGQMADLFLDFPEESKEAKTKEALNTYLQLSKGKTELTPDQVKELGEAAAILNDVDMNPNFYKSAPVQVVTKSWNTIIDFGQGLLHVAKIPSDAISKSITGQGNEFSDSDRTIRAIGNYVDAHAKFNNTIDVSAFDEAGGLNWFALPGIIAEQGTRMMLMYGAGAGATKLLAKTGVAAGTANLAGITTGGFVAEYRNLLQEAQAKGLSSKDAFFYAGSSSLVIGALEGMMGFKGFNVGRGASKSLMNPYIQSLAKDKGKTWTRQALQNTTRVATVAAGEGLEEGIQGRVPLVAGSFVNQGLTLSGENALETKSDWESLREELFIGTLMGAIFGMGQVKSRGRERIGMLSNILPNRELFDETAARLVEEGQITADELVIINAELDELQVLRDKIPEGTPAQQKNIAIQRLKERDDLKKQREKLDPAFQESLDEQIEQKEKEAADAVAGNRNYYKSIYEGHKASLEQSLETVEDEGYKPRLQAEIDQVNEVLKMIEDGSSLKKIRAKVDEVGAMPLEFTEPAEEPVTTEVITDGQVELADQGGKLITGHLHKTGDIYDIDDALIPRDERVIETTQDLDNMTTKTTNEQKAVKVEQIKREGKKPRTGKYQIGNKIYQTKEGFLKDVARMPDGEIPETFNFPPSEQEEVTAVLIEARKNANPFSFEELLPLLNNAEVSEIGQVLDRRTERLGKIDQGVLKGPEVVPVEQPVVDEVQPEIAPEEVEVAEEVVPPVEEVVEEKQPPVEEKPKLTKKRKQELNNEINDILGRLGGVKNAVGSENPLDNKDTFNDIIALVQRLAELGMINLQEGITNVLDNLKKVQELKPRIQPLHLDVKAPEIAEALNLNPPPPTDEIAPTKTGKKRMRRHGVESNTFQADDTVEQKATKDYVNENPKFYQVVGNQELADRAVKLVDDLGGVDRAYSKLVNPSTTLLVDLWTVARSILIKHYARISADTNITQSLRDDASRRMASLIEIYDRESVTAGRAGNAHQLWSLFTPGEMVRRVMHVANVQNSKQLAKGVHGVPNETRDQLIRDLEKKTGKTLEEIADDLIKGQFVDDIFNEVFSKKKKPGQPKAKSRESRTKDRIDAANARIEAARNKLKKGGDKLMSTVIPGLTPEAIEAAGEIAAGYVELGYWKTIDVVAKLREYFRANFDLSIGDADIDKILQKKEKGTTLQQILNEKEKRAAVIAATKDALKATKDIARQHWTKRDEAKRTLAQKLIDDAGLPQKEAEELADKIIEKVNSDERIQKIKDNELKKTLGIGRDATVVRSKKKTLERFIEAINLGALNNADMIEMFTERFGLKTLSPGEISEIARLTELVQASSDRGVFTRDASIELAKYVYNRYSKSRYKSLAESWIHLFYSSILSGPFTSVLNLWSASSNIITKPIKTMTNFALWAKTMRSVIKKGEKPDVFNPFGEMFYLPMWGGIVHGITQLKEVFRNGDFDSKYVEAINNNDAFNIPKGESDRYGKGKAYKPVRFKAFGKTFDLNIFNYAKYSMRNLTGQDKFMFTTSYDIELMDAIRAVLKEKTGLKGSELTKAVKKEYKDRILSPDNIDAMMAQVESEAADFEEATNKKVSNDKKKIRLRELKIEALKLPEEELEITERLARDNIFTGDRFGMAAMAARKIGSAINANLATALLLKPIVPFTRIVGNVTEVMLDHMPVYGILRAHGWTISGLISLYKEGDTHIRSAQKGKIGTREYYDQMGRASLGSAAFVLLAALGLGTDEDDWFQITGGFAKEGFTKGGRENFEPKYSVRFGKTWISYLNVPPLAIPMAVIGNANDMLRQKIGEEDVMERIAVLLSRRAIVQSMIMVKDMSFVEGVERMTTVLMDATSTDPEVRERAAVKTFRQLIKVWGRAALAPNPLQINAIQQGIKMIDPTSVSQKTIGEVLAYSAGIHHWVNKPSIDIFGDEIKTFPGESLMPYTHWLNLKGDDPRWAFLSTYNAIQSKVYNEVFTIGAELDQRRLEADELHMYAMIAGQKFSNFMWDYMGKAPWYERFQQSVYLFEEDEKTQLQIDVAKLWSQAKKEARSDMGIISGSYKPRTYEDILDFPEAETKTMEEVLGL